MVDAKLQTTVLLLRKEDRQRLISYDGLGNIVLFHFVDFVALQLSLVRSGAVRRDCTGLVSFADWIRCVGTDTRPKCLSQIVANFDNIASN